MTSKTRVAVLDDWQGVAKSSADWSRLSERTEVVFFEESFKDADAIAKALTGFEIIIAMRERTKFPKELIERLPNLRMIALTGGRTWTMDFDALNARGIVVSHTGGTRSTAATAELALAMLLSAARHIPRADASVRNGGFQGGVPVGQVLEGKTLGVIGLGKIGSKMARYGQALGMRVLAWSQNMTEEKAAAASAKLVDKTALLSESDAISLHLVLSDRTRGIIGAADLVRMKPGAILVNTSRGPIVDEDALVAAVNAGAIRAAVDVYDTEPLPVDHPIRRTPNTVLTPHIGYVVDDEYRVFYGDAVENIAAWAAGRPIRVMRA